MLNFKKGDSLARVNGGKYDGEVVYISDDTNLFLEKNQKVPFNPESIQPLFKSLKGSNRKLSERMDKIIKKVRDDDSSSDEEDDELYLKAKEMKKKSVNKELILYDGIFEPIPNVNLERNSLYVAGPSGSGKSTLAKIIGGEIKNLEPEKHEEVKWFSLNNLPEKLAQNTIDSISEYLKLNKCLVLI